MSDFDTLLPPIKRGPLIQVGETREGYTIYRCENGVGGYSYYTDELGYMVLDTALCSLETLKQVLKIEEERQCSTPDVPTLSESSVELRKTKTYPFISLQVIDK